MSHVDCLLLSITFVTSLFASLLTGLFISKIEIPSNVNHKKCTAHTIAQQQRKPTCTAFSSDTTTKHISYKQKQPKQRLSSKSIPTIPVAPITPPTSINKMHWMDGKWKEHTQSRYVLINSNHFDFKQIKEQNHVTLQILMEVIPSLSKDTIQIISSYISEINLCISKYVLLDCSNKYIQFFINDLDFNQFTKMMTIPININTLFTQQIIDQINEKKCHIPNISQQSQIECSIYFHDNNNAIIEGKYFILSLFCDSHCDIDMQCNILCQFKTNTVHMIQQINLHWTASLWSSKLSSFAKSPLLNIRFDGKYIYVAKDNILSVNSFDSKLNVLQNVISKHQPNKHAITCYRIYDCYLMVSRENYNKLELYKIDSNNIRYLYHEFELNHILMEMNNEYHMRFDKKGTLQRDLETQSDTILGFEMGDDIVFCLYYNKNLNRLFVANIKLSIFEEPKLINYNLLDGKIGNIIQTLNWKVMYGKCLGIEAICTNKGKDWLVFVECKNQLDLLCEIEFRINGNNLMVKYGKRKAKATSYRYLRSDSRKQMSFSCFM